MPQDLVRPLEDSWQDVIDAVLRRRGAPVTREVAKLAPRLVELSRTYNAGLAGDGARVRVPLDARIAFSFARDVPKGAGAVRELVRTGALSPRGAAGQPLRIVDLGAGLGAMTWGIVRALTASAARRSSSAEGAPASPLEVEALLIDEDGDALGAAEAIGHEASSRLAASGASLTLRTRKDRVAVGMKLPDADLVVLGQVLSELDVAMDPTERVAKHAALIADLLARVVAPDGALVVVEPALRGRTRHLHAVRDALALAGTTIFAPCLHALACPVLATENDWCHEDLAVDLPGWLVPLARAAGLRWQGLTFSYLVLRRDERRLADVLDHGADAPRVHLRVISELMRTKGKTEIFGCTATGERLRIRRLDRDATETGPGAEATAAWSKLGRGDVVTVRGSRAAGEAGEAGEDREAAPAPLDERGRVSATAQIDVWPIRK